MNQTKNYQRLCDAIASGNIGNIANALIYFEKQNPTIADSIERILEFCLTKNKIYKTNYVRNLIRQAVSIRRSRLGDSLWFRQY